MQKYHLKIFTTLVLLGLVSSFNITPLRAGTISISDADIRNQQKFWMEIDLNMERQFKQRWKNIDVIASITSLQMDDQLNFYFDYNIACPNQGCLLNFTFVRQSTTVNPNFTYHLTIDYLVARGMRIYNLNMTSYQQHIMISQMTTYDFNNQPEELGKVLPKNNEDALRIQLYPNGWSNLTRTGRVVYLMAAGEMYMYVIHYMEDKSISGHDNSDSMGWPQAVDFIQYKAIFFDYQYLPDQCKLEDKWALFDHYQSQCSTGTNDLEWFYGFKRTRQATFSGEFYDSKAGYTFGVGDSSAYYGILAFPFKKTDYFIDNRAHKYTYFGKHFRFASFVKYTLVVMLLALSAYLIFQLKRSKIEEKKKEKSYNVEEYDQVNSTTPKSEVSSISAEGDMG